MEVDTNQSLIGCWRVHSIEQIVGRSVSGIAGLPREYAEFTHDGLYRVDLAAPKVCQYGYRTSVVEDRAAVDFWILGHESMVSHCIWHVADDMLKICVALNGGEPPTDFRRDDELLWALYTFERSEPPKRRARALRRIPEAQSTKATVIDQCTRPPVMTRIADSLPTGPTSAARIDAFERYIGHAIPSPYRDFLNTHNGGRPVPDAFVLRGDRSEQENVVMCFFPLCDLARGAVKVVAFDDLRVWPLHCAWDDLQSDLKNPYETEFDPPLLPIGTDGSGNYISLLLTGDRAGAVVFLDHETAETTPLAGGFSQFLKSLRPRERNDYHPALGSGK